MPFKVQVGPPQISIHQGQTVLITEETGQINWPSDKGLYFFDTRVVSSWTIYANGEPWELLNGGAISYYASRIFLTNRSLPTEEGTIPPRTLGLTISRWISGGMHEDLDITNNNQEACKIPTRDRAPLRLRRYLRGEVRQHCASRSYHHGLVRVRASICVRPTATSDFSRAVTISPARSPRKGGVCQRTTKFRGGA